MEESRERSRGLLLCTGCTTENFSRSQFRPPWRSRPPERPEKKEEKPKEGETYRTGERGGEKEGRADPLGLLVGEEFNIV